MGLRIKDGVLTVSAPVGTQREYIDELLKKHGRWINEASKRDAKRYALTESLGAEDIKRLSESALEYFTPLCERFAKILGVSYKKISVSSARGRFGSCSSLGNIRFSYRLMLYPEPAREYVALHELCHLIEMNHSSRFYRLIESVMPDYKQRRRLLRLAE